MIQDDSLARRNAIVLAGAHAFAGANASVVIATGALVGQVLAPSASWATLPITTFVLGTALATMPAAWLMRVIGRRDAYRIGAAIGALAGLMAAYAVREALFPLFLLATAMCGAYQAFVVSYRFGATDHASPAFRPRAISYVVMGGLASAIVGPQLVIHTKDLTPPYTFFSSYLVQAAVAALAIGVLGFTRFTAQEAAGDAPAEPARPLRDIFRSAKIRVAVACGAIAQALMNLIMTATPLAMIGCDLSTTQATLAIQWHIVGMFLPGFFTGHLINRFGVYPVMMLGLALLAACGVVALMGITVAHFYAALILLGLGWNFAFVGASSLIAEGQRPAERTKLQGFNDLIIFSTTALASLLAGKILAGFGWGALNLTLFPFVGAAVVMVIWLMRYERRVASAAAE
jgi:MFS family permease